MKIISTAELRQNMKKYLDLAKTEQVVIQRGRTETFILTRSNDLPDDFNLAISMNDAIERIEQGMKKIISHKK